MRQLISGSNSSSCSSWCNERLGWDQTWSSMLSADLQTGHGACLTIWRRHVPGTFVIWDVKTENMKTTDQEVGSSKRKRVRTQWRAEKATVYQLFKVCRILKLNWLQYCIVL